MRACYSTESGATRVVEHAIEDETTAGEETHVGGSEDLPWIFAGRYEIRALLGVGGMGSVYEAFDRELEDVIALKIVRRELLRVADIVDRFRREVRLARKVTHPNVVRVYDLGEADGARYFTMERIPGRSLGTIIDDDGALTVEAWAAVARGIAGGLAAAHAADVIHRDLKPDNVVVTPEGRAVLTDFGVARPLAAAASAITLRGIGTPAYMAPELFVNVTVADGPCDVFSLGCVLFEAATGTLPWPGDDPMELVRARLERDAPDPRSLRPDLPEDAARLVMHCLARDRAARSPSAKEVHRAATALKVGGFRDSFTAPGARPTTERRRRDTPPPLEMARRSAQKTVAVMPFTAATSADEHLATGLTEVVIDALSRVETLRVRSRGRVMAYRGKTVPRAIAARELDARVVVEGSVGRAGPAASVAVRAFGANEDFPVWSARFGCDIGDLTTLGDAIAGGIAAALAVEGPRQRASAPADPRVAELLLRARQAYQRFWNPHAAAALALYEDARALAPDDPSVLAGWALAALRATVFSGESLGAARRAAARASAVAPDASEVRIARASIALQDGDVVAAVADAKRAVAASPSLAEAQALFGRILLEADLVPEGLRHLEWAVALEPELQLARWDLARGYALTGRWEDAERAGGGVAALMEGRWLDLARFALWRREPAAAEALLVALPEETSALGPRGLARALLELAARGTPAATSAAFLALQRHGSASRRRAAFAAQIEAEIACFEGKRAIALAAIATAADAGLTDLAWLMRCPLLDPLRSSPPFGIAVRHVGAIAARVREALFEE